MTQTIQTVPFFSENIVNFNDFNDPKWSHMVPIGPKWFKMVKFFVKITKNGQNRKKWSK